MYRISLSLEIIAALKPSRES